MTAAVDAARTLAAGGVEVFAWRELFGGAEGAPGSALAGGGAVVVAEVGLGVLLQRRGELLAAGGGANHGRRRGQ